MKKLLIVIVIILIIGTIAFVSFKDKKNEPKFKTDKVMRGNIESAVTATGTVNPVTTVLVGTQVSGTIKNIYVDFNSPVKKGEVIAQIDDAQFVTKLRQAEANLESAKASAENARANIENLKARLNASKADIDKARVALTDIRTNLDRIKKLWEERLASQKDMDSSQNSYDSQIAQLKSTEATHDSNIAQLNAAEAQYKTSLAQVKQSEASLDTVRLDLEHTRILSPVNGIVVSRNVDVGQTVAASFQTPTLFNIAEDMTKMQILSNISEADIGKIKVGQPVEFTVDAYPDTIFKGNVSEVRNAPITIQNVVTYDVVIKIDNPELKLKPGMTANVSISVSNRKDVIRIPNAALRFKPTEMQNKVTERGAGIWIIEDGKPKQIKVITGISNGNYTELISGDIKEGQELIVESLIKAKSQPQPRGPRMF
ncbi:MAG TPA: efflux RND transporter periplasmic adaptor subunit [Nitrospinae bacterium]|nr:efflux RND transporter periplasmic adaptor subunit [Nitrospinota bacterium]HBA26348.1 efflux RND transporter periplasmic adaptor subunit [Nitrospinota bacterium]